jgi:hypothetical protein
MFGFVDEVLVALCKCPVRFDRQIKKTPIRKLIGVFSGAPKALYLCNAP